ncbi:unnamed protein product, partial [Prorocentrum cordatum]
RRLRAWPEGRAARAGGGRRRRERPRGGPGRRDPHGSQESPGRALPPDRARPRTGAGGGPGARVGEAGSRGRG